MAEQTGFSGPELCRLTARDAIVLVKKGEIAATDLIQASLTRIDQTSTAINAMVTICSERARAAAGAASTDTLLAGLPLGIKDSTAVEGVRTTQGTQAFADVIPEASDPLVLHLEGRGGIVMGKTNTPELTAGANTFNTIFGATRNPWDTRLNAGGSSGGATAGLATGEVWLSHGNDIGGSLRTPAAYCGIVGLRPTPGTIASVPGPDPFNTMPMHGPMARNVADCALMLDAMAGWDGRAPLGYASTRPESYLDTCLSPAGNLRIAYAPDLGGIGPVDPDMRAALEAALKSLPAPEFDVVEAMPPTEGSETCFRALRALNFFAGTRDLPHEVTRHFKPVLKQNIAEGRSLDVATVADALTIRPRLYAAMTDFLAGWDVLAAPVVGLHPLPVEVEYPPEVNGVASRDYLSWLCFAMPASVLGLPALSLPIGFTERGIPVGLQLIGQPRGEARLLQVARAMEEALALDLTPIDPRVTHN